MLDIKYVFKLCINSCCCRRSFGAYTLHKERFFALKFKSIEVILPIWSLWKFLTTQFSEGFNRMQTPLLCIDPCEKKMSPPHSLFQIFSSFGSEYVSCRKYASQFWSFKKQKMLLLFTRFLKPLTFREITLHLPSTIMIWPCKKHYDKGGYKVRSYHWVVYVNCRRFGNKNITQQTENRITEHIYNDINCLHAAQKSHLAFPILTDFWLIRIEMLVKLP